MIRPIEPLTEKQYEAALLEIEVELSDAQRQMLVIQYSSPDRTVTAAELAQQVRYKSYEAANRYYGDIGKRIASAFQMDPPVRTGRLGEWWPFLSYGLDNPESGFQWVMHPPLARALETLNWVSRPEFTLPEEIQPTTQKRYPEGAVKRITVNAYERSSDARRRCIEHHRAVCAVCKFDFGATYGAEGEGLIHVHHEIQLSIVGPSYEVDPIEDLKPVCPNCHAMIHRRTDPGPYSVDEVREMMRKASSAC